MVKLLRGAAACCLEPLCLLPAQAYFSLALSFNESGPARVGIQTAQHDKTLVADDQRPVKPFFQP